MSGMWVFFFFFFSFFGRKMNLLEMMKMKVVAIIQSVDGKIPPAHHILFGGIF